MLVKMKTAIAGANFSYKAGETVDLTCTAALQLLRTGQAEPVSEAYENAMREHAENMADPAKREKSYSAAIKAATKGAEQEAKEAEKAEAARLKAEQKAGKEAEAENAGQGDISAEGGEGADNG